MAIVAPTATPTGRPPDPRRLVAANNAAAAFYADQLVGDRARGVRAYLRTRGLGDLVHHDRDSGQTQWTIGYAPPAWTALTQALRAAGFTDRELIAAGLSMSTRDNRLVDRFRDRLTFAIRDPAGHLVAFIARAAPAAGPAVPKYLNTPETAIYRKGTALFGVAEQHERIRAGWRPVLVEGPIDAIAVWLAYTPTARSGAVGIASCGTALTKAQAATLRAMPGAARGIVVAFDDDSAGHAATERAWRELRDPYSPGPLLAAGLAGGDPADLLRAAGGRAAIRVAMETAVYPLLQAVVDHRVSHWTTRHPRLLEDIGGRCAVVQAIVPFVFEASTAEQASHLAARVAARVGVSIETVAIAMAEHVGATVREAGVSIGREAARMTRPSPAPDAERPRGATVLAFPSPWTPRAPRRRGLPAAVGDQLLTRQDRSRR